MRPRRIEHARNISDTIHASASVTRVSRFDIVYATQAFESPRAYVRVARRLIFLSHENAINWSFYCAFASHVSILLSGLPSPTFIAIRTHFRVIDLPIARTEERECPCFLFALRTSRCTNEEDTTNFAVKNSLTSIYLSIGVAHAILGLAKHLPLIDSSFRVTCALLHVASSHECSRSTQLIVSLARTPSTVPPPR